MKEQTKLSLGMALLFLIVFVVFGVIIINDKLSSIKIPRIQEKIDKYVNDNYKDLDINIRKVKYKNLKYQSKITSNINNNYYFYIYYQDKKITDTYKTDYIEGKSIITYQEKQIETKIKKYLNNKTKVNIQKKLNKYSEEVQEELIKTDKPELLKIYTIEIDIKAKLDSNSIIKEIKSINKTINDNNIKPKDYTFIVTNKEDITESIKIKKITNEIIEKEDFQDIIEEILSKKHNLTDTYNIKYEYLN